MRFTKMHGAGNDFVVLDCRHAPPPDADLCRQLAERHTGVGCDQILAIGPPHSALAVASYAIFNADGSPSGQCGNGARCVAAWLQRDDPRIGNTFFIDSPAGTHTVQRLQDGWDVDMGAPQFAPRHVPMAGFTVEQDEYEALADDVPIRFGAVSMGNPHAVIEVDDVASAPLSRLGPALQAAACFPQSVNVGFAQVLGRQRIALRVHERGAGETLACGSGACAAVAVLDRRGRVDARAGVDVILPGGRLRIGYDADGRLRMVGPAAFVFEGEWP